MWVPLIESVRMQFPGGVPPSSLIPFLLQLPAPPAIYLMCAEAHFSPELRQQGILIGLSVPKLFGLQFSPSSASRVFILTHDHPPSWLCSSVLLTITCSVVTETLALDRCAFAPAHRHTKARVWPLLFLRFLV